MRNKKPLHPLVDEYMGYPADPGALQRIYAALHIGPATKLTDVMRLVAFALEQNNPKIKATDLCLLSQGLYKKKYNLG